MSNRDYTKFSNHKNESVHVDVEVPEAETAVDEPIDPREEPKYGVVTDCVKLNVRKKPDRESDVLCTVDAKVELVIVESESTEEFYKVYTPDCIEGFCMKRYVTVVP